jgi:excisionase family DNA binding protein
VDESGLITQDGDTVTIRGAPELAAVYRCVLLGIQRRRADGLPTADLQALARALYRAHLETSRPRRSLAETLPTTPCCDGQGVCDWLSVGEASALLGISRRQVQRMAAESSRRGGLDTIRVGRTWALKKAPVLAQAERRRNDKRPNGVPQ